jgi:hypothetical protein
VTFLALADTVDEMTIRLRAKEVAHGHAEAIGQQIGRTKDEGNMAGKSGASDPCHHGKGRDRSIDSAQNHVSQVAVRRRGLEARSDCFGRMLPAKVFRL